MVFLDSWIHAFIFWQGVKGTVYGETDLYFMLEMSYLGLEELKKNIIIEMLYGKSISSGVLCRGSHLDKK